MAAGLQGEQQGLGGIRGLAGVARPHPESHRTIPAQRMPTLYPTRSQSRDFARLAQAPLPRLAWAQR